jgi:hypothetical protein
MTVTRKFTYQSEPLKRLLQITDLENAPAVWHVIAAHNIKKQVRKILQTALEKTCYNVHLEPPVLHQTLASIIIEPASWRCASGPDNVMQGLSL